MFRINLLFICLMLFPPLTGSAQNLLRNGDFSQGLKHWNFWDPRKAAVEKAASPTGGNVLRVTTDKEHYGSNKSISGQMLKPDTSYHVTGWIKTSGQAKFYLHVSTGTQQKNSKMLYQTTPWTKIDIILKTGKAGKDGGAENGMLVATRIIGPGTAWFSDLSVTEALPPKSDGNLLQNGDFSQGLKHWNFWDPRKAAVEKAASPTGGNVLRVTTDKEHYGSNKSISGQMLKPDTSYHVTGWIKTSGQAKFYLHVSTGTQQKNSKMLYQTTPWTKIDIILKTGKAGKDGGAENGMLVVTRIIGPGTAWFSDLSVTEVPKTKQENLFINSDFRKKTVYRDLPDGWIPGLGTGTARPENYTFRIEPVAPPVKDAQVLLVRNVSVIGHSAEAAIPGNPYTLSFYAKNAVKGQNVRLQVRFGSEKKTVVLTDDWQRYAFTQAVNRNTFIHYLRSPDYDRAFYFSAPVLNGGSEPVPWEMPKDPKKAVVAHSNENIGIAESRRIAGEPAEKDWKNAPAYPIDQLSGGNIEALPGSTAKVLHNDQFLFVRFEGKKVGGTSETPDVFELFLCNSLDDGTYFHHTVESSGRSFSFRGTTAENLNIADRVFQRNGSWGAVVRVPLGLLGSGRRRRINFCRTCTHPVYGRTALDWAQPFSRHVPGRFGLLQGLPPGKQDLFGISRFYGSPDGGKLYCSFNIPPGKSGGRTVETVLATNGKEHWRKKQTLNGSELVIELPENIDDFTRSETAVHLEIMDKDGKTPGRFSRLLYLLFSSFARFDGGMEVFPKYNIFTDKDKNIELAVELDKAKYDHLVIDLLDKDGKKVFSARTTKSLLVPSGGIPDGEYRISVSAVKDGKVAASRSHETFRVLPWRPEMIRINRLKGCLMTVNGAVIPLMYQPGGSPEFAYDPGVILNYDSMLEGARKAGYGGIKRGIDPSITPQQLRRWLAQAEKFGTPYLLDLASLFPRSYYTAGFSKEEGLRNEKMTVEVLNRIQNICRGHGGIFSYLIYHEPNYFRGSEGIVDQNRMSGLLPALRRGDPWRPVAGIWSPRFVDDNGEPSGSIDAADYFFVDVYTRSLRIHCDELFRIAHASRMVRRPIGQIFNVANLGSMEQSCPTPAEYRAQLCTALIAGYRIFYVFLGLPAAKETWEEVKNCNFKLPEIAKFICDDNCIEKKTVNGRDVCFALFQLNNRVMLIYASKLNDRDSFLDVDLKELTGLTLSGGHSLFGGPKTVLKNGAFRRKIVPAGSDVLIFE